MWDEGMSEEAKTDCGRMGRGKSCVSASRHNHVYRCGVPRRLKGHTATCLRIELELWGPLSLCSLSSLSHLSPSLVSRVAVSFGGDLVVVPLGLVLAVPLGLVFS